jgi:hypothetical protein
MVISVGTAEQGNTDGSHYIVDPSFDKSAPWVNVPPPEALSKVISIQPAKVKSGPGAFILYQRVDGGLGCIVELTDPSTGQKLGNIRMLTADLGEINSICTNVNPWK